MIQRISAGRWEEGCRRFWPQRIQYPWERPCIMVRYWIYHLCHEQSEFSVSQTYIFGGQLIHIIGTTVKNSKSCYSSELKFMALGNNVALIIMGWQNDDLSIFCKIDGCQLRQFVAILIDERKTSFKIVPWPQKVKLFLCFFTSLLLDRNVTANGVHLAYTDPTIRDLLEWPMQRKGELGNHGRRWDCGSDPISLLSQPIRRGPRGGQRGPVLRGPLLPGDEAFDRGKQRLRRWSMGSLPTTLVK